MSQFPNGVKRLEVLKRFDLSGTMSIESVDGNCNFNNRDKSNSNPRIQFKLNGYMQYVPVQLAYMWLLEEQLRQLKSQKMNVQYHGNGKFELVDKV